MCLRSPHHDVVAGEVLIVIIQVHDHQVKELLPVHPLLIFFQGVVVFSIESLELVPVFIATFLQLIPVLDHVNIFQSAVVGIDVILITTFTDIEHTHVLAVDIDDGRTPSLPIKVHMLRHGTLDNGITHIQIVEIVTRITQGDAFEIGDSRSLVREELIFETFGSEALVGIDGQRLELIASCSTAHDACFAKLIETAGFVLSLEILELNGSAPVVLIILLPALVGTIDIDTDLGIVQVLVVGADSYDR